MLVSIISLSLVLFLCPSSLAVSDGVQNSDIFDETDLETVTELIKALEEKQLDEEDEQPQDMDFDYGYPNAEDSSSQKQAYVKYLYDHVPQQMLERRAGGARPRRRPTEEPCDDDDSEHLESHVEMSSHETSPGSLPGTPGIDYPNYRKIPRTSFSCAGRRTTAFYADVETRCQVFHVCYPHRRESFLCPVGTTFNQPILACDYWYNYKCPAHHEHFEKEDDPITQIPIIETLPTIHPHIPSVRPTPAELTTPVTESVRPTTAKPKIPHHPLPIVSFTKFLPVQVQVTKLAHPGAPIMDSSIVTAWKSQFMPPTVHAERIEAPGSLHPELTPHHLAASLVLAKKAKLAAPVLKPLAVKAGAVKVIAKAKAAKMVVPAIPILAKKHLVSTLMRLLNAHHASGVAPSSYYY